MESNSLIYAAIVFSFFSGLMSIAGIMAAFGPHSHLDRIALIERVTHSKVYLWICGLTLVASTVILSCMLYNKKVENDQLKVAVQTNMAKCDSINLCNLNLKSQINKLENEDSLTTNYLDSLNELINSPASLNTSIKNAIYELADRCTEHLYGVNRKLNESQKEISHIENSLIRLYPQLPTKLDTSENDLRLNLLILIQKNQEKQKKLIQLTLKDLENIKTLTHQDNLSELKILLSTILKPTEQ